MNEYWLSYAITAFLENFWYGVVATFGAIVGSFLGVVVYRLPIIELTRPEFLPKDYSLSNPPSYCPHCRHKLESWENVPLLGFLWLKGRCSDCKKPIPWRDFAMELLTACTWVAIFHRYNGDNPVAWVNVVLIALFASVLISAVFIDLDHFIVPEALNRTGVAIGLGRDLLVLGIAFVLLHIALPDDFGARWNAARLWRDTVAAHTYFGWLPRGFVGAALYAGVLWLVSFFGYLAYAREDGEPLSATARRFFSRQEDEPAPQNAGVVVLPATAPAEPGTEDEDDSPPIRLRFSPGFVVLLSAAMLFYVMGAWSFLAVVLPLAAFVSLTRTKTETVGDAFRRFFRADDLPYEYDAPSVEPPTPSAIAVAPKSDATLITGANVGDVWEPAETVVAPAVAAPPAAPSFAETQADADQFAKEAESGAHGGMGLGDAKLAITIGAILGPGQAILSLMFAAFFGAVTGLVLKAIYKKNTMRLAVPFVPFMAAGAFVCLLFGEQIVTWYMGFYTISTPTATAPGGADTPRVLPNGTVQLPSDRRLTRP